MVEFWKLNVTSRIYCFSPCFSACEHSHFFFFNTVEQSCMLTMYDCQVGNTEHFNLTRAFTSQGDLFVLCAKRPLSGLQLLSFCHFKHVVQPLQQLQSYPAPSPA